MAIAAGQPEKRVNASGIRPVRKASSGFLHALFGFDSVDAATVAKRCSNAAIDEVLRKVRQHIDNPTNQGNSMKRIFTSTVLAVCLATATAVTLAAPPSDFVGPYVGISMGRSQLGTTGVLAQKLSSDESDGAGKVYAGYQITDNFGVEAGYIRLGTLQDRFLVGGVDVVEKANARSLYVAGTGRLPLGGGFALTGKAGLSFGKVTGTDSLGGSDALTGSRTSAILGVGAEYRLNRDLAFTVDLDTLGKVSKRVASSALTAGVRLAF